VSEHAGRLKSRSDSAVQTTAVRTHARAPDRAAARARPSRHVPTVPRPDRCCPMPRARPVRSRRRRIRAVDAAVYTAAPVSASPPPPVSRASDHANPLTRPHSSPLSHRAVDVHARRATRRRRLRRRVAPSSTLR
jgi:hypothetical protein